MSERVSECVSERVSVSTCLCVFMSYVGACI